MNCARLRLVLVGVLLLLPLVILLLLGGGKLLSALGDTTGAVWFGRLALLGGVAWVVDAVTLLAVLGIAAVKPECERVDEADELG